MAGLLNADQIAALQRELATLDSYIDEYKVGANVGLAGSGLALDRYGIDVGARTSAEQSLLNRYLGNLQAQTASNRLGFDIGSFETLMYLQAIGAI